MLIPAAVTGQAPCPAFGGNVRPTGPNQQRVTTLVLDRVDQTRRGRRAGHRPRCADVTAPASAAAPPHWCRWEIVRPAPQVRSPGWLPLCAPPPGSPHRLGCTARAVREPATRRPTGPGCSARTVGKHCGRVCREMGTCDRLGAVLDAQARAPGRGPARATERLGARSQACAYVARRPSDTSSCTPLDGWHHTVPRVRTHRCSKSSTSAALSKSLS